MGLTGPVGDEEVWRCLRCVVGTEGSNVSSDS